MPRPKQETTAVDPAMIDWLKKDQQRRDREWDDSRERAYDTVPIPARHGTPDTETVQRHDIGGNIHPYKRDIEGDDMGTINIKDLPKPEKGDD